MAYTTKGKLSLIERMRFALSRARGIIIETDLKPYTKIISKIKAFDFKATSDEDLKNTFQEILTRAGSGGSLMSLMPEVFAVVREVCSRTLGIEPFDVQLVAGIAISQGKLAEMQTGEGKTLAAVFPACLAALAGRGVHVMTANDYLARRDAQWMGSIYSFLGLTTAFIQETMTLEERKKAYAADITYLTAKEAGFDFLRDRLKTDPESIVQRELYMAIVDEADFILVDEARIPLVIAGTAEQPDIDPVKINSIIPLLNPGSDFLVDRNRRNVNITLAGQLRVQELLGIGGMHEVKFRLCWAAVNVALHAHRLLSRDVDYIVRNDKIELVDEFTGRIADKRRWPYGIQTALEAKEGLAIQPEGRIFGSITIQHFLNLYSRISAMTATAVSAASEFNTFYNLATVIIPPNKPVQRIDEPDMIFMTGRVKRQALLEEIKRAHATGQPILVGTRSVHESEELAQTLNNDGIACAVLNAKNDEKEAGLVARAGLYGAVTISTNMAGRGTDIKLGDGQGNEYERIKALGGLYVIGTNRHESVRIDNQLRGRAGRQGDPGTSRFFISLEDPLFERYGVREFIPREYLEDYREDPQSTITDRRVLEEVNRAQRIIEGQNFVIRRTLRRYSGLVEKQRQSLDRLRSEALFQQEFPEAILEQCTQRFREMTKSLVEEKPGEILMLVFLYHLDQFWADHLAFIDDLREGIHLRSYGGREPLTEFIQNASEGFEEGLRKTVQETAERFNAITITSKGVDLEAQGLAGPSSTWTYLLDEEPLPSFNLGMIASRNIGTAALAAVPMFFIGAIIKIIVSMITSLKKVIRSAKKSRVTNKN